jgi:hypothetical protein
MKAQVVSQGIGGDVQRATLPGLLQRACACGGSSGLSGSCEECEKKNMTGMSVQAKLRVNDPGDEYEQEADQVAAQVMRMPDGQAHSQLHQSVPLVQRFVRDGVQSIGKEAAIQRAEAGEESAPVGEQPASDGTAPKDGSADGGGSRCPSWRNDPESISKRAAENYVQHDITPPSQARVEKINCEPPVSNGNYGCFVHFSDGLVVRVIVRATDIVVGMGPGQIATETPPAATPLCFYDYHCPDGFLVLTKRECKSAKAPSPKGSAAPTAVAQRQLAPQTTQSADSLSSVQQVLASPGRPLDASTREFFANRFGYDFGDVRIHDDATAAASARGVQALAYTVGKDVVFGAGQYAPGTEVGRHLLAHELTHVIQQGGRSAATIQRHKDDLVGYTGGQNGRVIVLNAGNPTYVAPAVSGHPGHGEHEPSVGPIPTGTYAMQPQVTRAAVSTIQGGVCGANAIASGYQEITSSDPSPCEGAHYCNVPCPTADKPAQMCYTPRDCWGPTRIKIQGSKTVTTPAGKRKRRDGFYLHGGNPRDAVSSGCVKTLDNGVFAEIRRLTGVKGRVPFCVGTACPADLAGKGTTLQVSQAVIRAVAMGSGIILP